MPYSKIIVIFLFELGFGIKFNLIGTISISELFLLFFVPLFILPKVRWVTGMRRITIAYALLLSFQVFSEIMVGNDLDSALKGLAITVVSYLHFLFLVFYLSKQKSLILILVVSQIVNKLIFGSVIEEQSVEDVLAGEAAAYLKFYVASLILLPLLALSMVYRHKYFFLVFSFVGMVLVFLGARSGGGVAMLSGLLAYIYEHRLFTFNKKALVLSTMVLCIVAYSFYAYYVSQVLAGEITSGNNRQLFLCKNPYNPLELLIVGRSEAWVGWQAFMDKFWFGHGAWPYDTTGRYQRMMFILHDELSTMSRNQISFHYMIPSHSVLIGSGMMNGVFAFLTMAYISGYFLWIGMRSFVKCENKYKLVLIYYVLDLFWTLLFSPQSHFRLTMPVSFAIIYVLYMSNYMQNPLMIKHRDLVNTKRG